MYLIQQQQEIGTSILISPFIIDSESVRHPPLTFPLPDIPLTQTIDLTPTPTLTLILTLLALTPLTQH